MAFAHKTLVLRNGKNLACDAPELLYKYPRNTYVARLFGEVNELPANLLGADEKRKVLVYPHELTLATTGLPLEITESYFTGDGYLIYGKNKRRSICFKNPEALDSGLLVHLKASKELLSSRLNKN